MASTTISSQSESTSTSTSDSDSLNKQSIFHVSKEDHAIAASTLAEAFVHDHVARYVIDTPDNEHWSESQKYRLHSKVMKYITYAHCLSGWITATGPPSDPYGCVALWMPPNCHMESLGVFFASGLWRLSYKLWFTGAKRMFFEFMPLLEHTKTEVLGKDRCNDCYYLVYLGTKASCRRMGLAKKLVEDVTRKADAEGRCCYLESSNVRNLKLYRRLGFEVRKRIVLGAGKGGGKEVPLDIMVREPGGLLSMQAVDSGVSMSPQVQHSRMGHANEGELSLWK